MNFIVDLKLFPFQVMAHFGDKKLLIGQLKKYLPENEVCWVKKQKLTYKSIMFKNGQTLLYMKNQPVNIEELSVLQHEITHCAIFILERMGIKLSNKTDEIYAYIIQYITKEIYEKLQITSFL